ncbi:MAG: hypothetical protein ABGX24_05760 [Aquificota bacterium]|jgi:hypothetical protein
MTDRRHFCSFNQAEEVISRLRNRKKIDKKIFTPFAKCVTQRYFQKIEEKEKEFQSLIHKLESLIVLKETSNNAKEEVIKKVIGLAQEIETEELKHFIEQLKRLQRVNPVNIYTVLYYLLFSIWSYKNLEEFKQFLNKKKFAEIEKEKLLQPLGYADCIAFIIKLNINQLRQFFNQIKQVVGKKDKTLLYTIFPMLAYAYSRGLIDENFYATLKETLLNIAEKHNKDEFEKALDLLNEFITALYAYFRKHNPKA